MPEQLTTCSYTIWAYCLIVVKDVSPIYATCLICGIQGSVVRRSDSAIHWIAIFSTFVKLAVDRYNLRLTFGIYKLKFLRSIVGSRSVVSQLFGLFYETCIIRYPVDSLSGLRSTGPRWI